jgi:hypothetical protein
MDPTDSKRITSRIHRQTCAPGRLVQARFWPHRMDRAFKYSEKCLHNTRMVFLIINVTHYFSQLYYYSTKIFWVNLEYLTFWGWSLVTMFFFCAVFFKPRSKRMLVFTSAIHHSAFTIQIFIVLMFWGALLPSVFLGFDGNKLPSGTYSLYMGFFEHSFPAFCIVYDYCISCIRYKRHGWAAHTGIVIAYVVLSTLMYNIFGIFIYPTPLSDFKYWTTYAAMGVWVILNIVLSYYLMSLKNEWNRKMDYRVRKELSERIENGELTTKAEVRHVTK